MIKLHLFNQVELIFELPLFLKSLAEIFTPYGVELGGKPEAVDFLFYPEYATHGILWHLRDIFLRWIFLWFLNLILFHLKFLHSFIKAIMNFLVFRKLIFS